MDSTGQVDAAVQQVKRVQKSLSRLKSKLKSPEAREKADSLEQAIKLFQSKLR
jgi:hypothetical protein